MNSIDLHSSNEHRLFINAILFANLAEMITPKYAQNGPTACQYWWAIT